MNPPRIDMSTLTKDQILHIAQLARLEIPEAQFKTLSAQFNDLVNYVEQLNKLDTTGILPTSQVTSTESSLGTPLRPDTALPSFPKEEVTKNAPDKQDQFFKVPRMIGEE